VSKFITSSRELLIYEKTRKNGFVFNKAKNWNAFEDITVFHAGFVNFFNGIIIV